MSSILNALKIISAPTRLRLFLLIQQEELSVAELQEILNMGQSRISTQLAHLKSAGLATDRKVGKNNFYSGFAEPTFIDLCKQAAAELPETSLDQSALEHILQKRHDKTRAHFDNLAGKFGKQYVPGRSWKALAEALLKILNYDYVGDFGAGEGTLSQLLAQRAKKVIAIDNSPKMVEYGSTLAQKNAVKNLEYRLGEIENPPVDDASLDLAVFSQALHHAHNPRKALREAKRSLKKDGTLIVLDLLKHNFEQARELYHDTWLGFSEVDLHQMLKQEGFREISINVVDKENESPHFQTLLAVARA